MRGVSCGLATVFAAGWAVGCQSERTTPSSATAAPPPAVSVSPIATVERIRRLREEGSYRELRSCIEPEQAADVVGFLMAMDEVLAANEAVRNAMRRHAPTVVLPDLDLAAFRHLQGVFSADVTVVDSSVEEPRAWVTIRVADQLPLERVELRRVGNRWLYHPDASFKGFPESLGRLAVSLRRVARAVEDGARTEEQIRDEYRLRVVPQVQSVQKLAAANRTP